jgi:hypothetical protein
MSAFMPGWAPFTVQPVGFIAFMLSGRYRLHDCKCAWPDTDDGLMVIPFLSALLASEQREALAFHDFWPNAACRPSPAAAREPPAPIHARVHF